MLPTGKNEFLDIVKRAINQAVPLALVTPEGEFTLRLQKGDYWIKLHLDNFYQGYIRLKGSKQNEYLIHLLAPFIRDLEQEKETGALDVRKSLDKIYPLVVGRDAPKGVLTKPLTGDLKIAYVLDQDLRIFFLDQDTLAELAVSPEKIHQIALANFRRDLTLPLQVFDRNRGILGFNYRDSYDSSRILVLKELLAKYPLAVRGRLLVMIPNRDMVMLFSDQDPTKARQAQVIGNTSFINNPYPVSNILYELCNGELTLSE